MSGCIPDPRGTFTPLERGKMVSLANTTATIGVFRLPTDPLFFSGLTLENIVAGSRYRVTRRSTGEELAAGVTASATEVIAGVPAYSNPMLIDITVRNASGTPAYKIFDTAAYLYKTGGSAYILQQLDE